ncbi:MAG: Rrf2 family transcriptional regulator [Clostridiales bacterium]|nr:Rrf2 family transcriptional regulator [Clostridiales bacterium]
MKLSTKGRYGLRVMYYLGQSPDRVITLSELAKSTGVNAPYLEKILGILKKADLVVTERGANGGYVVSRPANEISIGEILRALEDNLYLADCNSGKCDKVTCPSKSIFNYIYTEINNLLDSKTLQDMIGDNYE